MRANQKQFLQYHQYDTGQSDSTLNYPPLWIGAVAPEQASAPRGAVGRRPAPVNLSDLKHDHNICLAVLTGAGTEKAPAGTGSTVFLFSQTTQQNNITISEAHFCRDITLDKRG